MKKTVEMGCLIIATKAATPPAQCTTPLPAKSFKYKNRSGGYE
jgi:hypothetical protein